MASHRDGCVGLRPAAGREGTVVGTQAGGTWDVLEVGDLDVASGQRERGVCVCSRHGMWSGLMLVLCLRAFWRGAVSGRLCCQVCNTATTLLATTQSDQPDCGLDSVENDNEIVFISGLR